MRLLLTGAGGFIGGAAARRLRRDGEHELRIAHRSELEGLADATRARALLSGCDAVVHLANIAHRRADARELRRVNVEGTRLLAQSAAENGVRRFVYVSSIKALAERSERPLTGGEAPAPETGYGRSKLEAENALAEIGARTGLETISLRPPLVYGPGVKANFLALMRAIDRGWPLPFASIDNRRSLIGVENLADALAASLAAPAAACGQSYVLSDGVPLSTPELCRALARALGRPPRLLACPAFLLRGVPGLATLTRSLAIDNTRFERAAHWRPPFTLEQGLQQTARWYQSR